MTRFSQEIPSKRFLGIPGGFPLLLHLRACCHNIHFYIWYWIFVIIKSLSIWYYRFLLPNGFWTVLSWILLHCYISSLNLSIFESTSLLYFFVVSAWHVLSSLIMIAPRSQWFEWLPLAVFIFSLLIMIIVITPRCIHLFIILICAHNGHNDDPSLIMIIVITPRRIHFFFAHNDYNDYPSPYSPLRVFSAASCIWQQIVRRSSLNALSEKIQNSTMFLTSHGQTIVVNYSFIS